MNLLKCYQGFVDGKTQLEGSYNLLRIYRANREQRNLACWIEEAVKILSRRNPKISMDREFVEMLLTKEKECSIERESVRDLLRSCQA